MVERFFRDLTENRLRRGVFRRVLELIQALDDYVDHHNVAPNPLSGLLKPKTFSPKSCELGPCSITVSLFEAHH